MNAFYVLLKAWYCKKNYTSVLLTRECYKQQVAFCKYLVDGGDSRSSYLTGNTVAYKWAKKYHAMTVGEGVQFLSFNPMRRMRIVRPFWILVQ
jgi:hypothetical protein